MPDALTAGTWNLHGAWNAEDQTSRALLIREAGIDVLCAQEVTGRRFKLLLDALGDGWWGVHSLSVREGLPQLRGAWGVAVFGRRDRLTPNIAGAGVIGDPNDEAGDGLFWRRTLFVPVTVDGTWDLLSACIHVRPGSVVGRQKLQFIARMNGWLRERAGGPTIVGVDANYPGRDPAPAEDEWALEEEVWGEASSHGLRDPWFDTPTEPSFTHKLRSGEPRRFDHLYLSGHLIASNLRHLYNEACAAGSDHALVAAEVARRAKA